MELELQHHVLEGFYPVYHMLHGQEETLESIVPDTFPDIARIVSAAGQVYLKEKETGEGSLRLIGTAEISVLYRAEGENSVRALTVQIPFQVVKDSPGIRAGAPIHAALTAAFSDARMLNSRKILVRVGILCDMTVYGRKQDEITSDISCKDAPDVEKKTIRQNCQLISEIVEKPFVFTDVLRQSGANPKMDELLCCQAALETVEGKVIGSKVVGKGTLQLSVLYRSENKTAWTDVQLPFSQVFELKEDIPEGTADLSAALKGLSCSLHDGELDLSVELLLQGCVWVNRELTVISDAYYPGTATDTEYATVTCCAAADPGKHREPVRQFCPAVTPGKEVLCAALRVANLTVAQQACTAELNAEILYWDEIDELRSAVCKFSVGCALPPEFEGCCNCRPVGAVTAVPVTGGFDLRGEVEIGSLLLKTLPVNYLKSIKECAERAGNDPHPSVIIRVTGNGEPLWDIAKTCHSTVADICGANGLSSEQVPDGTMLLIPTKRR